MSLDTPLVSRKGLAWGDQGTDPRGVPSSWVSPKGIRATKPSATEESLPDESHLNSHLDPRPPRPGERKYDLSFEAYLTETSVPDLDKLLEYALGEKLPASSIGFDAEGAQTDGSVTKTADGEFGSVIEVTGDDGNLYYPFVITVEGNTAFFEPRLPLGVLPAGVRNASQSANGAAYQLDPTADQGYLAFETDGRGQTGEELVRGRGCVCTELSLIYDPKKHLGFGFKYMGVDYLDLEESNIDDVDRFDDALLAFRASVCLQTIGEDIAAEAPSVMTAMKWQVAPKQYPGEGSVGNLPASDPPGSSIAGFVRGEPVTAPLELTRLVPDPALRTKFDGTSPYFYRAVFRSGVPGISSTFRAVVAVAPEVRLAGRPVQSESGGLQNQSLTLQICQDLTLTDTLRRPFFLYFFGA